MLCEIKNYRISLLLFRILFALLKLSFCFLFTVPGDVKALPYIKKYPAANTDDYKDDKRVEICQTGFKILQNNGKEVTFSNEKPMEKLKAYILARDVAEDANETGVEIVPAYQCSIEPATYIHVHFSEGSQQPLYKVIFKDSYPLPTLILKDIIINEIEEMKNIVEGNLVFLD